MAAESYSCILLIFFCSVGLPSLLGLTQNSGCGAVEKPYVLRNLHNLSVGIANIQNLRDLALQPLLGQPRVPGTGGSRVAQSHIKTWMSSVGWNVERDVFYSYTPYGYRRFTNIIATLEPTKSRRLILACHYDSKLMHRVRFVGATDSAVPCSLLMDSALRLQEYFEATKSTNSGLTLQFIFFDGEEAFLRWSSTDSLYGSRHLAWKWASTHDSNGRNSLHNIEAFILLDLIGTSDTHFKSRYQNTATVYDKFRNIESCLFSHGHLTPTVNSSPVFTSRTDYRTIMDDHIPFYQRGVAVVHLITVPFPAVWHRSTDNLAALDFARIDNLARILRVFLADLPL